MKIKSKTRNIIIAVSAILITAVLTVSLYVMTFTTRQTEPPLTFTVTRRDVQNTIGAAGEVVFLTSTPVFSLEKYPVSKIYVKNGDIVKAGDKLMTYSSAELDSQIESSREKLLEEEQKASSASSASAGENQTENLQMMLGIARKQYENAGAELDELKEKLDSLNAEYDDCVALRDQYCDEMNSAEDETEYARCSLNYQEYSRKTETLSQKIESTRQLVTSSETTLEQLGFSVEDARLQLEKGDQMTQIQKAADELAQSALQASRDSLALLEKKREELTVYAETSGIVTNCAADPGMVRFNQPVMSISPENDLGLRLSITADKSAELKPGMKVLLTTDASDDITADAVITDIDSFDNGNVYVYGRIDKQYQEQFRYGMNVYGIIVTDELRDWLAVPYESIITKDDGEYVAGYVDGEMKLLKVTRDMEAGYYIAVSSDELAENTVILLNSDDYEVTQ